MAIVSAHQLPALSSTHRSGMSAAHIRYSHQSWADPDHQAAHI